MKVDQAFSVLGIPASSDADAIKKKYRALAKKYHPDINKDTGADVKFKEINEAYQVASSGKSSDREAPAQQQWNPGNPFNPFGRQQVYQPEIVNLKASLEFKDSILGCKKELKYARKTKCAPCNGEGEIHESNGCDKCGGKGQVVERQGFMVSIQTCNKCFGRRKSNVCTNCDAGVIDTESTITVTIPGGVLSGNILRLQGMGNYIGNFGPIEQYTDVFLNLTVTPDSELQLINGEVVSNLEISLLDALKGCTKSVKTILGNKDISVQAKAKNRDEVIIPHVGVNHQGHQKVVVHVRYPDDIDSLIETLSK